MVSELIGVKSTTLSWRSPVKMAEELGFVSVQEMKDFLNGECFLPFFTTFAEEWIWPAQRAARSLGSIRGRGPDQSTVETRLALGQKSGMTKYSARHLQKDSWDEVDHLALLLWDLREKNKNDANGLFYRKAISDAEINLQIWSLVKYCEYHLTPSKSGGKVLHLVQKAAARRHTSSSAQAGPSAPRARNTSATGQPATGQPATETPPRNTPAMDNKNETSQITEPDIDATCNVFQSKLTFEETETPCEVDTDITPSFGTGDPISNSTRMELENGSITPDMHYRLWQAWALKVGTNYVGDPALVKTLIDYASKLDTVRETESRIFLQELTNELTINRLNYNLSTVDTDEDTSRVESYLDSEAYQRDNIEESCEMLSIPYHGLERTVYRMPLMAVSQTLPLWQVTGIAALVRFFINPLIRGCVLGDAAGLGKTWMVIGMLLVLWYNRQEVKPRKRLDAKPTLILVPPAVIIQWLRAIPVIAPGVFRVYCYYGDQRSNRYISQAGESSIDGILDPSHAMFNGDEDSARTIVISSYYSFSDRNGPKAQANWVKNKNPSQKKSGVAEVLDPAWPGSLRRKFGVVVCDESHLLKTSAAKCATAVRWLGAHFYLMASATPIPNGIKDWLSYMLFIESEDAIQWWSPQSLQRMNIDESQDPFELPDDHPGAKLRLTHRAVKEFVVGGSYGVVERGQKLAMVWRSVLLRRLNASRIPFRTGIRIGDSLPKLHATLINCKYSPYEEKQYSVKDKELCGQLIVNGTDIPGKGKWSLAIHRKLQLLAMNLNLPHWDDKYNLKAGNIKATYDDGKLAALMIYDVDKNVDLNKAADIGACIHALCYGAPKLRALLKNISSQTIRDQEKCLIFCQLPAVTVFLYQIFTLLGVRVATINSFQTMKERQDIVDEFNRKGSGMMVLIMTYAVAALGLNLQYDCWRIHAIELAHNLALLLQALGRALRLGNPSTHVYLMEYTTGQSFDDRAIMRNIEKALPQAMAELNRQIFRNDDHDDPDSTNSVDMGSWVSVNGVLMPYNNAKEKYGGEFDILSPVELLQQILMGAKGQRIESS